MKQADTYEYYYGNEADGYTFYRLPKALFINKRFKALSDSAKILYGLMLDRMGLSIKNSWCDEQNRVYIIFTLENVQEYMNCKHEKAVKLLAELDADRGVGLIERVKRGQGKPSIIYVKKFFDTSEVLTSENQKSGMPDLQKSRPPKNRSQDFRKSAANKNEINNTELNDTDFSQSIGQRATNENTYHFQPSNDGRTDETSDKEILDNIFENCEPHLFNESAQVMFRTAIERLYYSDKLKIGNAFLPQEKVRSYLHLMNADILIAAFEKLKANEETVKNPMAYMMSVMFNCICEKDGDLLMNLPPEYVNGGDYFAPE